MSTVNKTKIGLCLALMLGTASATYAEESDYALEFEGVVEVEAGFVSPEVGDSVSDIVLATFEFVMAAELNDQLNAEVVLLYEDDGDEPLNVDSALLAYNFANTDLSLVAGQLFVPFGSFETAMVSDTLTLELAETRESSMMLVYDNESVSGSVYLFNGDNDKDAQTEVDSWGVNFGYAADSFGLGVGYISSIGDTDAIQDTLDSTIVNDYVAGLSLNATADIGEFTAVAEYISALDPINDLAFNMAEPMAGNLEFAYGFNMGVNLANIALGYQVTEDALALGLPETRIMLGLGIELFDGLALGFELSQDEDYAVIDGGSGESATGFLMQLAVGF